MVPLRGFSLYTGDDWIAWDKLEHFISCALITAAAWCLAQKVSRLKAHAVLFAVIVGISIGVLKEFGDWLGLWPGQLSLRDLAADLAGVLVAAAGVLWWDKSQRDKERVIISLESNVQTAVTMALVPFRTLGPAADQSAQERLFQVGGMAITIRQHPRIGLRTLGMLSSTASLDQIERESEVGHAVAPQFLPPEMAAAAVTVINTATGSAAGMPEKPALAAATTAGETAAPPSGSSCTAPRQAAAGTQIATAQGPTSAHPLGSVGLVAWQCGFLLADLLIRHQPLGEWMGMRVVDLGCGTGLVGIALALAGATVTLTDLPHVTPLAQQNVDANCSRHQVAQRPQVQVHAWGDVESAAALLPQPDLITAADVLYDTQYYDALLTSLELLCAPHTLVYLGWKKRHAEEANFQALAESRGFFVEQVPTEHLADEYREEGTYAVLRLSRLEPMQLS